MCLFQYLKKNPHILDRYADDGNEDEGDPQYSVIPYLREELPDSLQRLKEAMEAEYQDELLGVDPASDPALASPKDLAYVEGEAVPRVVAPPAHPHRAAQGEAIPDAATAASH